MKTNLIIILSVILFSMIASYLFINYLTIATILLLSVILFLYILQKNSINRKENLNIIRDDSKLYFYLSDDLLFTIELLRDVSITETIRKTTDREMATLKKIVKKICFINFKNEHLLTEINYALRFRE